MIRRISFPSWSVPILLLAVTVSAYGVFARQQGYHWDDWGISWIGNFLGKPGLDAYFAISRPFWSNLYAVTTSLIGPNPLEWQTFALVARWLMVVALWWVLRLVWSEYPHFAFTAALLALLYPGFSQHSIGLVYGHYSLTFGIFFASLALGILFMRERRHRWLALSGGVILSALHIFSVEYYFGLELLRPVLMWVAAGERTQTYRDRFKRALTAYIPFGLVLASFGLWRSFLFKSAAYTLGEIKPTLTSFTLVLSSLRSIWNATISAWGNLLQLPSEEMGTEYLVRYAGLILVAVIGITIYRLRLQPVGETASNDTDRKPFLEWFMVGTAAVLLAGLPFFIANLEIKLIFPFDRFTQPFAPGTAIILAAFLELLPTPFWRALGTAALAGMAIGLQIQNAYDFREDWRLQKSYIWQMAWRAPGLEPGTVIVSEESPFRFTDDDALTFAVNWLYDPGYESGNLKYGQVFLTTRPGGLMTPSQPVEWHLAAIDFISTTDSMIVVQYDGTSCLRVLHPLYDADLPLGPLSDRMSDALDDIGYPLLRQGTREALPLSNMNQIIPDPPKPAQPPAVIFGTEPSHQWCYYFEKADLARSMDDWGEVARLGDDAFSLTYHPNNLSEYLPFIEAYARLGRMKDAKKITLETAHQMPVLRPALCALWQRLSSSGVLTDPDQFTAREIQSSLHYCPLEIPNE